MTTYADIFTGGGGATRGALDAGLTPLWGIDHKDDIAQVARDNGFNVVTADVTTIDPSQFERPDILHASPPCPNFSSAKAGGVETAEDVALAQATVRFIEVLTPRVFTLENVWLYRKSGSWGLIEDALNRLGYWMTVQHLNSADFGVPQTRKRMIVRAVRGGWLPPLPQPEPWRGWYGAIEDLLPGLPDSQFAKWQLERGVQELLDQMCLLSQGSFDHMDDGNEREAQQIGRRLAVEPAYTVTSNMSMLGMRAFLVSSANSSGLMTIRNADEPANTVVSSSGEKGTYPRAFLATGQYAQPSGTPDRKCQMVCAKEPSPTVTASTKGDWRAAIPGRVVRMTIRCLARLQSFPDDYVLPDKAILAVRIIGNAVPPLWMQKLLEPFK